VLVLLTNTVDLLKEAKSLCAGKDLVRPLDWDSSIDIEGSTTGIGIDLSKSLSFKPVP
jgi:hypothetical protein